MRLGSGEHLFYVGPESAFSRLTRVPFDKVRVNAALKRRSSPLFLTRGVSHAWCLTRGVTYANVVPFPYQTWQAFSATMGWPALQPQAFWNSGMFWTTPFTR